MKLIIIFFLTVSCLQTKTKLQDGECVLGPKMEVWKLLRMDEGKHLFVTYPFGEGDPVEVVTDVSAFKKVDCPL